MYQVALAGIAAALALLFVWLGVVIRYSTVAFFIAAGLVLMVPMTRKYYLSALFAYAVSAGLGFLVAGDVVTVFGYIVYFGPISLITGFFYNIKLKQYFQIPIKLVYINGAIALLYFVLKTIVIDDSIIERIPYWGVAVIGSIALILIDFVVQYIYKCLIPIVEKVLRKNNKKEKDEIINDDDDEADPSSEDSPFDDMK